MKVTEDDILSLQYFHREKGDITRWAHWESKRWLFEDEFPELVKAMEMATTAIKLLDVVVESLEAKDESN